MTMVAATAMPCDRAFAAAWGEVDLDPFTERHVRWCGHCRSRHPQQAQLRTTLVALRDAVNAEDPERLEALFVALDAVDRQRRHRAVAAVTGAAAAALVMAGTARRLVAS